jgi:hypothetical protein
MNYQKFLKAVKVQSYSMLGGGGGLLGAWLLGATRLQSDK